MPMRIPDRSIVRAFAWRGVSLWFLTRLLLGVALLVMAGGSPAALRGVAYPSPIAIMLGAAMCFVDVHVRRERALIANLAVSRAMLGVIFIVPMIAAETVVGLVGSALR
jgi:hypothetical protein